MKTRITFFAAIFMIASLSSFATVRTVSNHPLGGAQYTNLEAAYNASTMGDTLIFEGTGSASPYGMGCYFYWDKSLTVIGAGFNTGKQNFKPTCFTACWGFEINGNANGSSFYGITFLNDTYINGNNSTLLFEDCQFSEHINLGNGYITNIVFRNCVFNRDNAHNIALNSTTSSTVSLINCVFDGYIEGYSNVYNTLLVDHCLFLSTTTQHFSGLNNASITNCIFMNQFPSGTSGCTYLNNICRVAGTLPPAGNSGSGNISSTDPLLVSYTAGSLYSTSHNFHLQAGSPCSAAGSDGTDIGVHASTSTFSESGEALVAPVVRSVQINNTIVAPNGTLDVDISASKPTDE